ncbi:MAG: AI-2E family transporter [Gammaproteobacteria bacterium]
MSASSNGSVNVHRPDPERGRLDGVACIGFGLLLILVVQVKLLPALLAGLLVYALVDVLVPTAQVTTPGTERPRMLAVLFIAAVALALMALAVLGVGSLARYGGENVPALMQRMAEIMDQSRERLPPMLLSYVPDDAEALRRTVTDWLRSHVDVFQIAGAELVRAIAHLLVGMVAGALISLERASGTHGPLAAALTVRAVRLARAFRQVVFAQIWISAINTSLTAVYLALLLPAMGIELPFVKTMIAVTFVAGLIPILGNLLSNFVICVVSLSHSLAIAVASLAYLVVIHKMEYFLNARIIGGHIRARAWEMLLAMLVMEASFGIGGLIAAPIYYAYLKEELLARELI